MALLTLSGLGSLPVGGEAQGLQFPANAVMTDQATAGRDSYMLPTGPVVDGVVPGLSVEGRVDRQAWRIAADDLGTLQIMGPLRDQITADGFRILLDCETEGCGGFDFRFGTDVLPPPAMYVDLGDYRFVSGIRLTEAGEEAVSVLVSRSTGAGHVQVVRVTPGGLAVPQVEAAAPRVAAAPTGDAADIGAALDRMGHAVLNDLTFDAGSAQLGAGPYPSLVALAAYLQANPDRVVSLVGHTDATGSLEANVALSRRRAGSVMERLTGAYGIARSRLDAEGMGYLAPIASNLTEEGRDANRRVEVILTLPDPP